MNHEQSAPIMTAKPAEYQPVPTVDRNAQYPTIVAAPPYRANLTTFTDNGPRPNNFIMLTVITLFCCMGWPALFCSVIAIIYSMQVGKRNNNKSLMYKKLSQSQVKVNEIGNLVEIPSETQVRQAISNLYKKISG